MKPAFILMWPLARILGCPCCGPQWYARLWIWAYETSGQPVPPELGGPREAEHG